MDGVDVVCEDVPGVAASRDDVIGIGRLLSERIQGNYWEEVAFIIIVILVAAALAPWQSRRSSFSGH
ncbi:MAG: hypothetical protein ACK4L4_10400 [Gemmobacter sp.]